ncbi:MAG: nucleotidyltransferase family protein [Thaumarchaeota archaeon]|nr:nucleotidyltransferase family protein [Nitrososphaerota archaeon]
MRRGTQAAVLCGGRGERLRPLTDYFQKVMIPIGPKKLPLLAYIIRLISHHHIERIALLTGYRSHDIRDYFADGSSYGVKLSYSEDKKDLKGSLNAVANALRGETIRGCDELLLYYGDVLTDLDISGLLSTHRARGADATLVLSRGYALPVGTADVGKGGMVSAVREKPSLDLSVTMGCMVVGRRAMKLASGLAGPQKTDLMTHFLPALLDDGGRVAAFYSKRDWYDVGTVSNFEKLNEELRRHPLSYLV